jgi:hypothetical protein
MLKTGCEHVKKRSYIALLNTSLLVARLVGRKYKAYVAI